MKKMRLSFRKSAMLVCAVVFDFLVYYGARWIAAAKPHWNFTTSLDRAIPLVPWTAAIYWGCYLFWAANYVLSVSVGQEEGMRFLKAHFLGESIGFACFVFLPTTMVRPEILEQDFSWQLLQLIYRLDTPDNLLPSIHCFASWLCWIGVRGKTTIPQWYQRTSLGIAVLVCISVLTVKQHILVDVFAGILLAEGSYWMAGAGRNNI